MRQKTKNVRNQGSNHKKMDILVQSLSHIPRWVRLVQKTRLKNSHAWAPLNKSMQHKLGGLTNPGNSRERKLGPGLSFFLFINH
jgi:hypothetical protein